MWLLAALWLFANAADTLGIGGRPWYGFWDSVLLPGDRAYTVVIEGVVPGGTADRAGMRDGDRVNLREQTLDGMVAVVYQPFTLRSTPLTFHRGASTYTAHVVANTIWEISFWPLIGYLPILISGIWFLVCALFIAVRKWWSSEGRYLTLILLLMIPGFATGATAIIVTPDSRLTALMALVTYSCALAALALLVRLSSSIGVRSRWRRVLELIAYAAIVLLWMNHIVSYFDILALRFDPTKANYSSGGVAPYDLIVTVLVVPVMVAAVSQTAASERPRSAWLLLPLSIALLIAGFLSYFSALVLNWYAENALQLLSASSVLLGALLVTYAVLKQRVLDFEFIIGRTLVVAAVSAIVVAAFVLLEWFLGTVLVGVSHTTGLVANAALALVLGVSLSYIHKRVDQFVDAVLFRKRHEDERALVEFSKEAAYVTEPGVLLDTTLEKLRRHTDARNATILLEEGGCYSLVRSFGGDSAVTVSGNDEAILSLKAWHKPLDPHHYATSLRGALALPIVARGRLLGILLLGERAGGEAYAPDEVEALLQLAHGVGSALDSLSARLDGVQEQFQEILSQFRAIADTLTLALERRN
jgi:hypothetical protein